MDLSIPIQKLALCSAILSVGATDCGSSTVGESGEYKNVIKYSVCDRIENSDRTGLGSFWPEPDWITSQKKFTGFDRIGRILPDF